MQRNLSYSPYHYFQREDVRMNMLTFLETTTYYPFKGYMVYL
ncbi:DUF427 domain-containing protein [Vreelandella profundi]